MIELFRKLDSLIPVDRSKGQRHQPNWQRLGPGIEKRSRNSEAIWIFKTSLQLRCARSRLEYQLPKTMTGASHHELMSAKEILKFFARSGALTASS